MTFFLAADEGKKCKLMRYTDSSWCGDPEDKKSTSSYVLMLGCASVAWRLRKEPFVALSSCKAEYITASLCACQVTWMMI